MKSEDVEKFAIVTIGMFMYPSVWFVSYWIMWGYFWVIGKIFPNISLVTLDELFSKYGSVYMMMKNIFHDFSAFIFIFSGIFTAVTIWKVLEAFVEDIDEMAMYNIKR